MESYEGPVNIGLAYDEASVAASADEAAAWLASRDRFESAARHRRRSQPSPPLISPQHEACVAVEVDVEAANHSPRSRPFLVKTAATHYGVFRLPTVELTLRNHSCLIV